MVFHSACDARWTMRYGLTLAGLPQEGHAQVAPLPQLRRWQADAPRSLAAQAWSTAVTCARGMRVCVGVG
jgi:hypothetical protein